VDSFIYSGWASRWACIVNCVTAERIDGKIEDMGIHSLTCWAGGKGLMLGDVSKGEMLVFWH
jgi:hypothetical protein